MEDLTQHFYDLPILLRLHDLVAAADPDGPPSVQLVYWNDGPRPPARLGFLAGSFNPLHAAHEALARAALAAAHLDQVVLVLSKRTVDKEQVSGLCLEDRLLLLQLFASTHPRHAVALVNRGLYYEQAAILRSAWPDVEELWVLVGFDKMVQIFDPRYYVERDAALEQLFTLAGALVAPRAAGGPADLARLLDRPENRRFRDRVRPLLIDRELEGVASSQLRSEAAKGHIVDANLPRLVSAFLSETRAYAPPTRLADGEIVEAYGLRVALLSALSRARPWSQSQADFRALLNLALGHTRESHRFRTWLQRVPSDPSSAAATLRSFQHQARRDASPARQGRQHST